MPITSFRKDGLRRGVRTAVSATVLGALGFLAGTFLAGGVLPAAGVEAPPLPEGVEQGTLLAWMIPAAALWALAHLPVAAGIRGGRLGRWAALAFLTWVTLGPVQALEANAFTTLGAASGPGWVFTTGAYLGSALLGAAGVVLGLGRLRLQAYPGVAWSPGRGLTRLSYGAWAWRLAACLVGFVGIYLFCGRLVAPFVLDVYRAQLFELRVPDWGEILRVQLARSGLLLLGVLPVVRLWRGSTRTLFLSLGAALFVLLGGYAMVQAYWLPAGLRLIHGVEILADGMVYAGLVTLLLGPAKARAA